MSTYLSCVITCETAEIATQICKLLDRKSRPIFEEDLLEGEADYYRIIENIEFPNNVLVIENSLIVNWENKDRFNFSDLMPIFSLPCLCLSLVHEMDSYIGSGDDDEDEQGRYWFMENQQVVSCNARDLCKSKFAPELELLNRANQ